jgi:subtilisin family serine protease
MLRNVTLGLALTAMAGCGLEAEEADLVQVTESIETPDNSWIVVFKPGVSVDSRVPAIAAAHGVAVEHTYRHALQGFSFRGSEQAAAQIANLSDVSYIEPDQIATIIGAPEVSPQKGPPGGGGGGGGGETVPWGVTRVGGGSSSGSGTAWIIDTGIDLDHGDLNVDVARSANFITSGPNSADDGHGHGTHVAGTVAAIAGNSLDVVGVAPGAPVVAVRVLDNRGSGSYSGVIAGVDYVAANASNGDVANMSLGGPVSAALDSAVKSAASSGVKFALAAGNDGDDADNHSPARANGANIYTISAIASNDCLTSWSNWAMPPVDYAAPGSSILSTKKGGGTTTMSGTSMASPHVAGLLLLGSVRTDGQTCSADPGGDTHPIAHN